MDLLGAFVKLGNEAMRKAREDFRREREAMQGYPDISQDNLSEDEELQLALAMSENESIQQARQEREIEEEAQSFHLIPNDEMPRAPNRISTQQFDSKIADTSDLTDEMDVLYSGTDNDELLARQLQQEEEAELTTPDASTTSLPLPITPPIATPAAFDLRWGPPPGPLPIVTSSPPFPWLRGPVPPSPGPRPFFGGLTDSQLAREIQAEEDDPLLAANEQPAHYRPPAPPATDNQLGSSVDDALTQAMEESRREAEEQERRALREQQEMEYQETLLMDQIRESEREEEEKRKRRQEEEEERRMLDEEERKEEEGAEHEAKLLSLVLKRDSEIARLREIVPGEVTPEQEKAERAKKEGGRKACMLIIRLTNGSRLERRFWGDHTLLDVKHFVDLRLLETAKKEDDDLQDTMTKGEGPSDGDNKGEESQQAEGKEEEEEQRLQPGRYLAPSYSFVTTFPQKTFTNWNETLEQAGLCPRALVCVKED